MLWMLAVFMGSQHNLYLFNKVDRRAPESATEVRPADAGAAAAYPRADERVHG